MTKEKIIQKICNIQMDMIINDTMAFQTDLYKNLELLKVSIKSSDELDILKEKYKEMVK